MKVIFLDDDPNRQKHIKSVLPFAIQTETADETIALLKQNGIDYLFLDHDLGGRVFVDSGEPNTGMVVAKWLSQNPIEISLVIVHSYNPAGAKNIYQELKGKYQTAIIPFRSKTFDEVVDEIQNITRSKK